VIKDETSQRGGGGKSGGEEYIGKERGRRRRYWL